MSEQLAAELYERLMRGKSDKPQTVFHRGWNAAIDFAIKQLKLACDEPEKEDAA